MIWGNGIDLVDLKEFERLLNLNRENFLNFILTEKEKNKIDSEYPIKKIAGIFSAKEAVFKSLNLPKEEFKNFNYFQEIEIDHLDSGKPIVNFLNSLAEKFLKEKFKIFISISYNSNSVISCAIIEKV